MTRMPCFGALARRAPSRPAPHFSRRCPRGLDAKVTRRPRVPMGTPRRAPGPATLHPQAPRDDASARPPIHVMPRRAYPHASHPVRPHHAAFLSWQRQRVLSHSLGYKVALSSRVHIPSAIARHCRRPPLEAACRASPTEPHPLHPSLPTARYACTEPPCAAYCPGRVAHSPEQPLQRP